MPNLILGGLPTQRGMIPESMPAWLGAVIRKIERACPEFFPCSPNHVLVNEYLPGQGIMV
jgi:alkylated DNA repair protein alkB homolog 6